MGLLLLVVLVIGLIAYSVSMMLYKQLVKTKKSYPLLWSSLVFIAVAFLIGFTLFFAFMVSFHR